MENKQHKEAHYNINEVARGYLKLTDKQKLPTRLHDVLQNIFTKSKSDIKYRKPIVTEADLTHRTRYLVYRESENAIYNALCLFVMYGTGETNKVFQQYFKHRNNLEQLNLSKIIKVDSDMHIKHHCLGIKPLTIEQLELKLRSNDFNLYRDKLPSPFDNANDPYDLTPMVLLYSDELDLADYMNKYQQAQAYFENKQYQDALMVLESLDKPTELKLPVLDALVRQIEQQKQEAQEAWELFQKLLT